MFQNYLKNESNSSTPQPQAVYFNLTVEVFDENEKESNDVQMTRMVKAMTFLFVVLWLPFFITVSLSDETADYGLKKYTFLLAILKSALSPILCIYIHSEFRIFVTKFKFW